MDATRRVACNDELFNPILTMGMQVSCILVLSHIFQVLLKPLGQPGPIAQILAGFVLGPSGLSHIKAIKNIFFQNMAADYYETMALFSRIIVMFLIGLEMDVPCLMRNLRQANIIAGGGCVMCSIFAAAITPFIYEETAAHGSMIVMAIMVAITLANAASPIVIRVAAELKFATSEFGRLAIAASLMTDMYCVVLLILMSKSRRKVGVFLWLLEGLASLLIVVGVIILNMYITNWINRRNTNRKHLNNAEMFGILSLVVATALALETMGFNSIIGCFLVGSMFPRGGRTTRTLLPKLNYSVHSFILPIYFGYAGFQADVTNITNARDIGIVCMVIVLSLGGKISGTLAACHYLNIPLSEGVLLAFLMSMKGHLDLVALTWGLQNKVLSQNYYGVIMTTVVINTLIAGPVIAFMVRKESEIFGYRHVPLELQNPETELRLLACVHNPRPVATMLGIIAASRGGEHIPVIPFLMHLIELPEKTKTNLMYHQREDDELSDGDDYGGNDVVEINNTVDAFTAETRVFINQVKVVSPFANMFSDVSERAEDIRASLIVLPFHKHQRIDGKMENDKEGIRTTNQKILRHAPCSVAILVDRGLTGMASQLSGSESLRQIAILFFSGPDDREALGLGRRLGMHHHVNLTVIRFMLASSKNRRDGINVVHKEENVLMAINDDETEDEEDNKILADFYNRYVTSGQVGYVEKFVENGGDVASALRDMAEMYSVFIVGKGTGRGNSPLTTGLSDWEECPELGAVGDLLASSEFDSSGSVLVIQQNRGSNNDDR